MVFCGASQTPKTEDKNIGLNRTMVTGGFLQVFALGLLTVDPTWLSVGYVMSAMAKRWKAAADLAD